MEHLEYPDRTDWESRRTWFEETLERHQGQGSYLVSEQACALIAEVQACFCVGAWVAVTMLVLSVVDAQLRETEIPGFKGNTKDLLDEAGASPALQHLRKRRNTLVHVDPDQPALTVDDQWSKRDELEREAREAIELMFEAFFIGPWT